MIRPVLMYSEICGFGGYGFMLGAILDKILWFIDSPAVCIMEKEWCFVEDILLRCNGLELCAIIILIEHIFYNGVYFCLERNMAYGRKFKSRGNIDISNGKR